MFLEKYPFDIQWIEANIGALRFFWKNAAYIIPCLFSNAQLKA